ncbi:PD-(D/E)XK nuclease family protein [Patescibacteria group bacterium]|nr:PD-(D/E)XK nuclease family protein [Patescibacteria group bacterium]
MRYSEAQAFNTCPGKYKFQMDGLKKEIEGSESNARVWGQAIHKGLEANYKGLPYPDVEAAFKSVYTSNLDPEDLARTKDSGLEVLRRYVTFYASQDELWEVMATEFEDEITIGDEEHGLHIDLIARNKQSQEIYFWDHKTSGKEPGITFWKPFELSGQISRYTAHIQNKFGSCAGCYINAIAVKHLLRKNKYGEGPGLVVKFERQLFNRTPQQIAYWRQSDEAWMKMMEFSKRENVWPLALGSICGWCEYYDLCLASNDDQIRELLYKPQQDFNVEVA